jgi:hypothetical protein
MTAKITSRVVARSPSPVPSNMVATPTNTTTGNSSSTRRPSTNGSRTSDCQARARLRRRRCRSGSAAMSAAEEGGSIMVPLFRVWSFGPSRNDERWIASSLWVAAFGSRASNSATGRLTRRNASHSAANAQPNTSASFQAMSSNWS